MSTPASATITLDDGSGWAQRKSQPIAEQSSISKRSLPKEFDKLLKIDKVDRFLAELGRILGDRQPRPGMTPAFSFSIDTIHGIVELVHQRRNSLCGSKRKHFDKIIPDLMNIRRKTENRQPKDLANFFYCQCHEVWPQAFNRRHYAR